MTFWWQDARGIYCLMTFLNERRCITIFATWRINGDWQRIHEQLRQWVRAIEDRHPSPSAAILDSQSVETATMIHPEVGYDGGKKTKGRKRHL